MVTLPTTSDRDVDIAFGRGWERNQRSATSDWSREDSERIERELAELFAETARRELQVEGGYEIVSEAGQDVLEIRLSIIDLYINIYRRLRPASFAATPLMQEE
ncbi:MAG TPA: hypothetical protein VNA21_09205 [Steroidobacteraceae bacterium]|nr:hypothetical protein [Steroidobacteraceae bacterium]